MLCISNIIILVVLFSTILIFFSGLYVKYSHFPYILLKKTFTQFKLISIITSKYETMCVSQRGPFLYSFSGM